MKKLIALFSIIAAVAAVTACTGLFRLPAQPKPTQPPEIKQTAQPSPAPPTVEELVAAFPDSVRPRIEARRSGLEGTMDFDCFAEGRDLVLEYRYKDEVPAGYAAKIVASLEAQSEDHVRLFGELSEFAGDDSVRVVLRYFACDGSKLLDYVVDKDYSPRSSGVQSCGSLEELISSAGFRAWAAEGSSELMESFALLEGGDKVVICRTCLTELSEKELEGLKADWLVSMRLEGERMAEETADMIREAVPESEFTVVFRLCAKSGETIAEYPENE